MADCYDGVDCREFEKSLAQCLAWLLPSAHRAVSNGDILRHTYASYAVMNGMRSRTAEQLGHKDTRITEHHYAHLCESYKREFVRANAPSFGFGGSKPGPVLVAKVG